MRWLSRSATNRLPLLSKASADGEANVAAVAGSGASGEAQGTGSIIADGCEKARKLASETMRDVREAMGLDYS